MTIKEDCYSSEAEDDYVMEDMTMDSLIIYGQIMRREVRKLTSRLLVSYDQIRELKKRRKLEGVCRKYKVDTQDPNSII